MTNTQTELILNYLHKNLKPSDIQYLRMIVNEERNRKDGKYTFTIFIHLKRIARRIKVFFLEQTELPTNEVDWLIIANELQIMTPYND